MLPRDLEKLYVRNSAGKMVPFSSFASTRWSSGSPRLERFNGFPSMNIWAEPAKGHTTGEAMKAMEELTARLSGGVGCDWTGLSYQERQGTSQAPLLYAFAVFAMFLYLAALYESWPLPISIMLVLPLGAIGGILASTIRGLSNDVYFQIGVLNTLGLTIKNAILIVQFAKDRLEQGAGLLEAATEAVKLRFRPILMTSMTTGLSVLPWVFAAGAGAGSMNAVGVALVGGMVTGTILVVLFTPLFYVMIEKTLGKHGRNAVVKFNDGSSASSQEGQ
jgi:HAE1 family hydrophobic/amphiphilic exporter-1